MDKYTFLEKIGEGSYAVVYKATSSDGTQVAIKALKDDFDDFEQVKELPEVVFLGGWQDSSVVRLHEVVKVASKVFLVFDFCPCNLYQAMTSMAQSAVKLSEPQVRFVMKHLLAGLAALHSRGIMHRDVKPDNMLLTPSTAKVCDFGQARKGATGPGAPPLTSYVATRWYRAPELLLRAGSYSPAVDLWAAGCTMGELYLGRPLFPGTSEADQLFRIASALGAPTSVAWPALPSLLQDSGHSIPACSPTSWTALVPGISETGAALLGSLLQWNPAARPTAAVAGKAPFFSAGSSAPVAPVIPPRRPEEVLAAQADAQSAQAALATLAQQAAAAAPTPAAAAAQGGSTSPTPPAPAPAPAPAPVAVEARPIGSGLLAGLGAGGGVTAPGPSAPLGSGLFGDMFVSAETPASPPAPATAPSPAPAASPAASPAGYVPSFLQDSPRAPGRPIGSALSGLGLLPPAPAPAPVAAAPASPAPSPEPSPAPSGEGGVFGGYVPSFLQGD